jgi:polyisoprenoid-binding protein YceI
MKKILLGFALACAPLPGLAVSESYTMDPYHTFVHFAVDHNDYSWIWGRFDRTTGKFTLDREARSGTLEITVETASVSTGDSARGSRPRSRDEHLKSADFFNTAEFPRMTFKSAAVRFSGEVPADVRGDLTLLGVTRPVALVIDRWKCAPHPVTKRAICGGNATGSLKRSEFGMKWGIPATGDEVRILVTFEAFKD